MLGAANIHKGEVVLDVGCGGGGALALAARSGAAVYGLDASKELVSIAASRVNGTFVAGEMEELPYSDATFDVVLTANGLQYASDRLKAASEIRRVLKRGGRVVVGLWAENEKCDMSALFATLKALVPPPAGTKPPTDLSIRENLLQLLASAGFRARSDGEVDCPFLYRDAESYWIAMRCGGVVEAIARRTGEAPLKSAVLDVARPFTRADGSVLFRNKMRWVLLA